MRALVLALLLAGCTTPPPPPPDPTPLALFTPAPTPSPEEGPGQRARHVQGEFGVSLAPSALVLLADDAVKKHGSTVLVCAPMPVVKALQPNFDPLRLKVARVTQPARAHVILGKDKVRVQLPGGPKLALRDLDPALPVVPQLQALFHFTRKASGS